MEFTPKCDYCGQRKEINNDSELPAMFGFQLGDGTIINACYECISKIGEGKIDIMEGYKKHD